MTDERKSIANPTADEIREAADRLNFNMDKNDLDTYEGFMGGLTDNVRFVDELDEPIAALNFPRTNIHRPADEDNPYNAWYYKCNIKGAEQGKLVGKTIAIKDNISVAEVPMMNGSDVYEGFVPKEDARVVERVLEAGGEILGKAVCENFCFSGGSHTSATGPVRNPHNESYMAGGSSSGCAALIVGGHCDMAIGSDQGGSVRMPASFSGCYGIKPTYGLVPYTGAGGIEYSVDHLGPMAGNVSDLALLLEVISGYDNGCDPRQKSDMVVKTYSEEILKEVKGLKIGIVAEGFGTPGSEKDVDDLVKAAALSFTKVGCKVQNISIPMHVHGGPIMMTSILDGTLSTFTDNGPLGPCYGGYASTETTRFYQNVRKQRADKMPVTVKTTLLFAQVMRMRFGNYYSAKAQNIARILRKAYDDAFSEVDLLVMPTTPMKAHKIPSPDASLAEILGCSLDMLTNTAPFDVTGHPSMSVPLGKSAGLPVGMMLTGRAGEDDVVLRAGHAFEKIVSA